MRFAPSPDAAPAPVGAMAASLSRCHRIRADGVAIGVQIQDIAFLSVPDAPAPPARRPACREVRNGRTSGDAAPSGPVVRIVDMWRADPATDLARLDLGLDFRFLLTR